MDDIDNWTRQGLLEEWVPLKVAGGSKVHYSISSFGRIRTDITSCGTSSNRLRNIHYTKNGNNVYPVVVLSGKNGYVNVNLRREVAKHFIEIPRILKDAGVTHDMLYTILRDPKRYWDNSIYNLEWSMSPFLRMDDAIEICEGLVEGKPCVQIANELGVSDYPVRQIKYGITWVPVSQYYDFQRTDKKPYRKYSDDQIELVKEMLSLEEWSMPYIAEYTGMNINSVRRYKKEMKKIKP